MLPKESLPALAVAACLAGLSAAPARAAVLDAATGGFTSRNTAVIAAPPALVYQALAEEFGQWWDPAHSYFGDGKNFHLDARPGGAWIEDAGDGRAVQHMQVINADPGKLLRLSGGLGPLQEMGVVGVLTWQLNPAQAGTDADAGTEVVLTYAVGGYHPQGLDTLAPIVDMVLAGQLQRLKVHAER